MEKWEHSLLQEVRRDENHFKVMYEVWVGSCRTQGETARCAGVQVRTTVWANRKMRERWVEQRAAWAEEGGHQRWCSPDSGISLMTGDPCFGIFLSRKCKAARRVHCRGVMYHVKIHPQVVCAECREKIIRMTLQCFRCKGTKSKLKRSQGKGEKRTDEITRRIDTRQRKVKGILTFWDEGNGGKHGLILGSWEWAAAVQEGG